MESTTSHSEIIRGITEDVNGKAETSRRQTQTRKNNKGVSANQSSEVSENPEDENNNPLTKPQKPVIEMRTKPRVPSKIEIEPRGEVEISLRSLLEAGVHFGHQTSRWNPAMAANIHSVRNGIHIISLPKTIQYWAAARKVIVDISGRGGSVLFVGTKKQAHESVVQEALRAGAFFISRRWLGGMLTNFQTIRKSIDRMKKLELILEEEQKSLAEGGSSKFTKKERLLMSRELEKLEFSLGGIRDLTSLPSLIFVIDVKREEISIKEAKKLDIPVVALVDTNCDPRVVTYPVPSNDDGTRAIKLFCSAVSDAISEGKKIYADRARQIADKREKVASSADSKNVSQGRKKKEGTNASVAESQNESTLDKANTQVESTE